MNKQITNKQREIHSFLIETFTVPSCLNCISFDEQQDLCLKWKSRPPARIIVLGCPDYEQDIPF